MSTTTTAFRLPFLTIPTHIEHGGKRIPIPHQIIENVRLLSNGLLDAHQAVISLKSQLTALQAVVAAIPTAAAASSSSPTPGGVNDQSGATNYTLQSGDYGGAVVVNNGAVSVPVTLNSGVKNYFFTKVINNGSAASTLTPDSTYSALVISAGSPSGSPSFSLGANSAISLFFNSQTKNWYAF